MSKIFPPYRYNRRHKIVIGVIAFLCLALQIFPYMAIVYGEEETEHKACIEISKKPDCASEKDFYAYEISDDRTELSKLSASATCYDYYANKNMKPVMSLIIVGGLILLADIIVAAVGIITFLVTVIAKFIKWLNEDDEREYPNENDDEDWDEEDN